MADELNTFNDGGPFIVAEISKNWIGGESVSDLPPLCVSFEHVINVNWDRGYRLLSFQLHRLSTAPDAMNETIIAVFERIEAVKRTKNPRPPLRVGQRPEIPS